MSIIYDQKNLNGETGLSEDEINELVCIEKELE